jgi:hypothetical protein
MVQIQPSWFPLDDHGRTRAPSVPIIFASRGSFIAFAFTRFRSAFDLKTIAA